MGCEPCNNKKTSRMEIIIIIAGLRQSGKTAIFFKLTDHPHFTNPVPTIHLNSEIIQYRNKNVTLIDLPPEFTTPRVFNLQGIIFVVDSSDKNKIEDARLLFTRLIAEKKVPVLLLLSKKDKAAVTEKEVQIIFQLKKLDREVRLQICSGLSGEGVYDGFAWLFQAMTQRK